MDESEEKYKDQPAKDREEGVTKVKSPTLSTGSTHSAASARDPVARKISSPPAPGIMYLRRSASPEDGVRPRRHSHLLDDARKESAELSQSVTPQHRKLLANMASGANSPKQERPQVRKSCLHSCTVVYTWPLLPTVRMGSWDCYYSNKANIESVLDPAIFGLMSPYITVVVEL